MAQPFPPAEAARRFVVIGATNPARRTCASLTARGHQVRHLTEPGDDELRDALDGRPDGLAVLLHDDHAALRYTLAAAHVRDDVPIVVSVFDRTVAAQVRRLLPQCAVASPADLATPTVAGACLDPRALALCHRDDGASVVTAEAGPPHRSVWHPPPGLRRRAFLGRWTGQLRPYDAGTRILTLGLLGLGAVLASDVAWQVAVWHRPALEALFEAARVVATVGPASAPEHSSRGYLVFAVAAMLGTVVLTALFTAGVVDRLLGPRLVALVGPRTLPRSGHVVVVGFGQVGLRLCEELRRLGLPVVAVERDASSSRLRLARRLRVPVVLGNGEDRALLERLRVNRAIALVAAGSDDLENLAVAVTAHAVAPGTTVVMRAGEHEAIAETRSLLPLGVTRDVAGISAAWMVAHLLGAHPVSVACDDGQAIHVEMTAAPGEETAPRFVAWDISSREECPHVPGSAGS
jgi:Trk K+ transport system NAD-binding subunit